MWQSRPIERFQFLGREQRKRQADLAALTEQVRRRAMRWFRLTRLLDAAAAADMLAWKNSGLSIVASVRNTLIDRDVPSCFQSLEHLLLRRAVTALAIGNIGKRL